ncbi:MAG: RsmE family RNA methyltransferase, partial [Pirellulaceae bacterium]
MSNRFFVQKLAAGQTVAMTGQEAQHMTRVMRLGVGDHVTLFDGEGHEADAIIESVERKAVVLSPAELQLVDRELPFRLVAGVALPKSDRLKFMIEKLTELGVSEMYPVNWTRASVIAREGTLEKMRRYVIEASKQCGRNVLMKVQEPLSFAEWCRQADPDSNRLCCDTTAVQSIASAIGDSTDNVWYCI